MNYFPKTSKSGVEFLPRLQPTAGRFRLDGESGSLFAGDELASVGQTCRHGAVQEGADALFKYGQVGGPGSEQGLLTSLR
jgi:hypothetical protein